MQRAKKSLGQNFLTDRNIARKIVEALSIAPEDRVLEIGPGPGALTGYLQAAHPACLVLAEKDHYWAAERQKALHAGGVRGGVLLTDALTLAWERFTAPWKFIGNLPYNVASPLMWDCLSRAPGLTRAVFMIQKEVGERITAAPGGKAYGALSVWLRSFCAPKLEFIVPPQVFNPRPKVDSAVLSFVPLPEEQRPTALQAAALSAFLHRVFQQRRKQLGTIVKGMGPQALELLEQAGISSALRPEVLTPEQFLTVSQKFSCLLGQSGAAVPQR